jgi:hypothetical protein
LCVIKKPRERGGHGQRWAAEPREANKYVCKVGKGIVSSY